MTTRSGKFRAILAMAALAAAGLGLAGSNGASASAGDKGVVALTGTATLSGGWPCAPNCNGTFAGKWSGTVAGVTGTQLKALATYTYNEPCPPVTGSAKGKFTFYNKANVAISTEYFNWTRVGQTAVVTLSDSAGGAPDGVSVAGFAVTPAPPTSAIKPPCSPKRIPTLATIATIAAWT